MGNKLNKKIEKAEKELIGQALAYCFYVDYLGPRGNNRHLNSLCKATDKLRKLKKEK